MELDVRKHVLKYLHVIRQKLPGVMQAARYPSPMGDKLRAAAAEVYGVDAAQVIMEELKINKIKNAK